MYIKILICYMLGFVNITVEGFFIERFINTCISKRIFFWETKRTKSTIFSANIGIKNFKEVVKIAKKCKCKIKINSKNGLPFLLNRYRKRKFFVIALGVIICAIIATSNFIWNIEITGIKDENIKAEILQIVNKEGIHIGKFKRKINLQNSITKIRIQRNDIAWVGMKIKGTNLIIEVVPAEGKPEIINENEYCNIIAIKDGIIEKVEAQNGTPVVKKDDVVKKGDILIKGEIEGKYTDSRLVHSEGEVFAKVWYTETEKVYYNQVISNQTGNKERKYYININNFQINFFKTLSKFENYDTIRTIKKLKVTSNFYLPIELGINEHYEKEISKIQYSKEQAKEKAIQSAKAKLNEKIKNNTNVLNMYLKTEEAEEYIEVKVIYEVLESIGTKEKIEGKGE